MGLLHTMDKFHVYQIINSSICILCGSHIETHDHLFFHYPFSTSVWGLRRAGLLLVSLLWRDDLCFSGYIHTIGRRRNLCIYLLGYYSQPQFTSSRMRGIIEFLTRLIILIMLLVKKSLSLPGLGWLKNQNTRFQLLSDLDKVF